MILDNAPGAGNIVSADKNLDITDQRRLALARHAGREDPAPAATKPGAPAGPGRRHGRPRRSRRRSDLGRSSGNEAGGGEGGFALTAAAIAEAVGGRTHRRSVDAGRRRGAAGPRVAARPELPRRRQVRADAGDVAAPASCSSRRSWPRRRDMSRAAWSSTSRRKRCCRCCRGSIVSPRPPRRRAPDGGRRDAACDSAATCRSGRTRCIGDGAAIGDTVVIGAHCVVGAGVRIGDGLPTVPVGDGLQRRASSGIASRFTPGARIGSDGFGYVQRDGQHLKIPHVGRCIIEDDVEIGANTTIDRGSIDDTVVGAGTKIDNLVQIAHNVRIGKAVSDHGAGGHRRIGARRGRLRCCSARSAWPDITPSAREPALLRRRAFLAIFRPVKRGRDILRGLTKRRCARRPRCSSFPDLLRRIERLLDSTTPETK